MLLVKRSRKFKKDFKKISANVGFRKDVFEHILQALIREGQVEQRFLVHKLKGVYHGCFECHVHPDILLIYEVDEEEKKLYLLRIGTHSELF